MIDDQPSSSPQESFINMPFIGRFFACGYLKNVNPAIYLTLSPERAEPVILYRVTDLQARPVPYH